MNIFQAIFLGIVQGFTEFLPISSSGHLVMFQNFFGLQNQLFLTVALHVGTLFSVVLVYRKDILYLIKNPFSSLSKKLVLATIPTVLLVFIFKSLIENSFSSYFYILGFAFTGLMLILTEILCNQRKIGVDVSYKSSFLIGVAQGIAALPGISRSGSTICMGLILGEDKENVTKFSFLLSIPIIIASCIYELIFGTFKGSIDILPVVLGGFVAMIAGITAIKLMINIVSKTKLKIFGYYLIILSLFLVIIYSIF